MPRRVIVDADAGPGTEIWQKFQDTLHDESYEYLFLTEVHVGIPDVEILDKLLHVDDTLLTGDCVLHMRALSRGCQSFTVDKRSHELTSNPLPYVNRLKRLPNSVFATLLPDYRTPVEHPLTRRLKTDFTEREAKGYRTARRRIRSHFGAADAIAQVSATIGAVATSRGLLCGLVMQLAGNSGVKGRFHDGMQAKLSQLVRSRTNEIKSLDFNLIAQHLCTEEASDHVPF